MIERRLAAVVLTAAILCGTVGVARADESDDLIAKGFALRNQEHPQDAAALELFAKAYALKKAPKALAQMALAEQALGRWLAADEHIRAALAADQDVWVIANRKALEKSRDTIQQHIGTLELSGNLESIQGIDIRVSGKSLGTAVFKDPARLEVGSYTLEVTAPGYYKVNKQITISAGGTSRETIELQPDTGTASVGGNPGSSGPGLVGDPSVGRTQRTIGWIGVGTGVALAIAGSVFRVLRESKADDFNTKTDQGVCWGLASPTQPNLQCSDLIKNFNTYSSLSLAGWIAGGVFVVGGIVLVATAPSSSSRGAALKINPNLNGGAVSLEGRF